MKSTLRYPIPAECARTRQSPKEWCGCPPRLPAIGAVWCGISGQQVRGMYTDDPAIQPRQASSRAEGLAMFDHFGSADSADLALIGYAVTLHYAAGSIASPSSSVGLKPAHVLTRGGNATHTKTLGSQRAHCASTIFTKRRDRPDACPRRNWQPNSRVSSMATQTPEGVQKTSVMLSRTYAVQAGFKSGAQPRGGIRAADDAARANNSTRRGAAILPTAGMRKVVKRKPQGTSKSSPCSNEAYGKPVHWAPGLNIRRRFA